MMTPADPNIVEASPVVRRLCPHIQKLLLQAQLMVKECEQNDRKPDTEGWTLDLVRGVWTREP